MQIIKKPSAYTFAGNCAKIELTTSALAQLLLNLDGVELLRESYEPTAGLVTIDLTDILLKYTPSAALAVVAINIPKFSFTISNAEGSVSGEFFAINGGHGASVDAQTFLKQNWLTWQPQSRTTSYHAPQRLVYAAIAPCSVLVKAYFADKSTLQAEHSKFVAGKLYTIDATFGTVRGLFSQQPVSFDIWIEGVGIKSYPQRYYLAAENKNSDVFLWRNSIGGVDTVAFAGDRVEKHKSDSSAALLDDAEIEYDINAKKSFLKYTGYFDNENERLWVLDFFNSRYRYHLDDGVIRRVIVTKPKLEHTRGELAGYEFEFAHSDQSVYLNLPKVETPALLEVADPTGELFFLAPRLNQFAAAEIAAGDILIPCQYAGAEKWLYVAVADIVSNFGTAGGGGSAGPIRTLAPIGAKYVDGTLTITHNLAPADVAKFGTADKTGHAMVAPHPYGGRGDVDFSAKIASAIKLLLTGEASSPDYVKALTGFSLKKNEYGKWTLELDNISVRESLSVPEFIKNRITVTNNQMWIADNGIIDDVAEIPGSPGERLITVAQDKGGGSTFVLDDLLRGTFLDEKNGSLNFQTVLLTVRQVISPYVLRVSVDENTPPPRKELIIVRAGNRTNAERQNSIFIDAARPAMFFYVNVDSHQISERNIAQATGNLQGMNFGKITDYKPITERFSSIMRGDNYIVGRLMGLSGDGLEYHIPVDRGEWMAGTYYHYDRVSCDGAMWDCAVTETTTRPTADALDWTKRVSKGEPGAPGDVGDSVTGKMLYRDPEFRKGVNGCYLYDYFNRGNVTLARIEKPADCPTTSTHCVEVRITGSKGGNLGGFLQQIQARANAVFIQKIVAKVPVGYELNAIANSLGDGGTDDFITHRIGTGKYETYLRKTVCGTTGTFGDGGYVCPSGSPSPTSANPLVWQIASCTCYDLTDSEKYDDAIEESLAQNKATKDFVDILQSSVNKELLEVNKRLDGVIVSYFETYDPTLTNLPASEWVADKDKESHLGDTFTNKTTGNSWKWKIIGGVWQWVEITDTIEKELLKKIASAQDTADSKRRNFVSTPTTPYDIGDTWSAGVGSDLMRCISARVSGAFVATDWDKATKYTDDTKALEALADANRANALLADIANDDKLIPSEKSATKKEWDAIVAEYPKYVQESALYSIDDYNYNYSYKMLSEYIAPLLSAMQVTSDIVGTTFRGKFNNYYSARQNVVYLISVAVKDATLEALADANRANALLADIANDDKLIPSEKSATKKEWDAIVAEYPKYVQESALYSIDDYNYNYSYKMLSEYIAPLLSAMQVTSDIVGTTFRGKFNNYYSARQNVVYLISVAVKDATLEALADANRANAQLAEIASDGKLTPSEKQQTAIEWSRIRAEQSKNTDTATTLHVSTGEVLAAFNTLNSYITPLLANLSVTSDINGGQFRATFAAWYEKNIALVNAISKANADKAAGEIEIGGVNLISKSAELSAGNDYASAGRTVSLKQGQIYTLSYESTNIVENATYPRFYLWTRDWNKPIQDLGSVISVGKTRTVTCTLPDGDYWLDIYPHTFPETVRNKSLWKVKFESGNKKTAWSPAPNEIDSAMNNLSNVLGHSNISVLSEWLAQYPGNVPFYMDPAKNQTFLSNAIVKNLAVDTSFINALMANEAFIGKLTVGSLNTKPSQQTNRVEIKEDAMTVYDAGNRAVSTFNGSPMPALSEFEQDGASGSVSGGYFAIQSAASPEGATRTVCSLSVTRNNASLRIQSSLSLIFDQIDNKPLVGEAKLELWRGGSRYTVIASAIDENTIGVDRSVNVEVGDYSLVLRCIRWSGQWDNEIRGNVGSTTMSFAVADDALKTMFGANGYGVRANKLSYEHTVFNPSTRRLEKTYKGDLNMPGVLAKAHVNIHKEISRKWGHFPVTSVVWMSGNAGNTRVWHYPISGQYSAFCSAYGGGITPIVYAEESGYVDLYAEGAFNIMLVGSNE